MSAGYDDYELGGCEENARKGARKPGHLPGIEAPSMGGARTTI
jgi:hypothetical protein